jgi:predicted kinase
MNRLVVITVGKTHSGKTTFAKSLEAQLHNTVVIDQDNHAAFINTHYQSLRPKEGPNTLKYAVTQTIIDFAVDQTEFNLVLCNSNLARKGRSDLLDYFRDKGFMRIIVYFDIPDDVLQARVAESRRSKEIFRSASTFAEVLARQQSAAHKSEMAAPEADESDHFFVISCSEDVTATIGKIIGIAEHL